MQAHAKNKLLALIIIIIINEEVGIQIAIALADRDSDDGVKNGKYWSNRNFFTEGMKLSHMMLIRHK